jgi:predicted transcriptional regulator
MTKKPEAAAHRSNWFDETTRAPLIEDAARKLDSFTATMTDGRVDAHELQAQEARLVDLMKEIEPELDDPLHEKITRLLCELTAYNLMQMLHAMQEARPKTAFRG